MIHSLPSRPLLKFAALFCGLLLPVMGQQPDANPKAREGKNQLRFVCVSSLQEQQEVVLASKDDEGKWIERGTVELRSSFITEWLPAAAGKLHLALREGETLKSIGEFNYPASARRAFVILIADPQKNIYRADVVDPESLKFEKGSVLIVNFSSQPGVVLLGSKKVSVNSGQRAVSKPALESNGMYRMMVAYLDPEKNVVPCYDRYTPGNPDSRKILFLFPDPTLGLKVFSLPMFGELE
jgi:hypothetical protein